MTDPSPTTTPEIGFFFWPTDPEMVAAMGTVAERYGFDLVGVADSPGQCLDCWVSATLLTRAAPSLPVSICVSNFASRHWTTTASAAASLAMAHAGGFVLGVGAGHSAVRNFGLPGSTIAELEDGTRATMRMVRGEPVVNGEREAQLTWTRDVPRVFLAASHPRSLRAAGAIADGVFINYGLHAENIRDSTALVVEGASAEGRDPAEVDIWQVAALDCAIDGDVARAAVGKICAFIAGYVIGTRDPATRGVPEPFVEPMRELVARYSTRPSQADTDLVNELGLSDYLSRRVAVCGSPQDCLEQIRLAARAGARRLMFSVGRASDPLETVELIGREVLPALRGTPVTGARG